MNKIKITDPRGAIASFEVPWEWIPKDTYGPELNDLESKAERGINSGYLSRSRAAEIPAATLQINKELTQKELWPLWQLLKLEKINIYYFEKYLNKFVTREFYAKKPNPKVVSIPDDNNTDEIIYSSFEIQFTGYGDVN